MATISSPGVGTNGLDVKSIISQLVTLEKRPLDNLKVQAAVVNTKISAFGQIKSLVSALADAAGSLTSLTGWNGVSTTSSDSKFVSATAIGGTQPTSFSVEVQSLAKAQSTASAPVLPVGAAVGAGTLRLTQGAWSGAVFTAGAGQPLDIAVSAGDSVSDIASKINGANASVTATVLTDASGERLLLRSKATGEASGFNLTVDEGPTGNNTDMTGLSRLTTINAMVTQSAADAKATVNGIAVSSATNTFDKTISGVTFKAEQVTTTPIEITVSKDTSAVQAKVDDFVKAYNAINQLLQDATKYDAGAKSAGLLQGDSTAIGLQNSLRSAMQSVTTSGGAFQRLADIGIAQERGGNLSVNATKLNKALTENPDQVRDLFRNTGGGAVDGIAVKVKALTTNLLSNDGFFKSKDDTLQMSLKRISKDQLRVNERVNAFEQRITRQYNALDTQLSNLNGLNAYIAQQVTTWNKSNG
ncbi:flagellar filament capping protein FliD [Rhodoferax antarcticus]|uniref:Flagellar hook-associated protein 2 n=1 Tax=Rhodoferax antarcticus ANT.BR TaxID=1111071 RepID=A0A1Q8YGS3_9BURK|nr:flagellar filament capping protein FliD [Rhodoferax antarcticus]APW45633.1 flagellar cap protein FliD [Rhodoferax antarcticus]MCW2312789.1 flagellar hook-associated protein 2 [Rhodoferax antarcticus]OLP07119.1 flagellar cap protein fliD [Rhodoferax antarcticus ANT.BR]